MKFTRIIIAIIVSAVFFQVKGENEDPDRAYTLDELNVTAVKQTALLDKEPEASTVLTREELEQLGIVSMRGISDVVPNFYMPDYGSRITSTIYVRGIGARMDQPSVGLNVDNVPYLNKDAYDFDIADIATVEMLRGPQSTLYGRNTMAGVINITTLSPLLYQGWRLFGEVATGGAWKLSAGWYHRFNHKLGLAVNADFSSRKGTFTNLYNGRKVDHEKNGGGRVKLNWNPSSAFSLMNVAALSYLRQGGYPYEYIQTGEINYNDTCFYRRFTFNDGLTSSYSGSKFKLISITSVQHIDANMTLDQDFLPLDYFTLTQKKKETAFTEEVVTKGNSNNSNYKWITGVFGFYKHLNMHAPVTFKNIGIKELIEDHRNDANPHYPIRWDSRTFPLNSDFTIPTGGIAIYHESELKLGNWNLTAGLRLDYEKSILKYRSYCDTGYEILHQTEEGFEPFSHVDILIDDDGNLSKDFLTLLPKIAAVYNFSGNPGNIYAKISKGYKAGGFNTQMFSDVLQQRLMSMMGIGAQYKTEDIVSYKPEESWNYEIGSHLFFFDSRLSMELTAFLIDCRNQQLTMFPDGTTTGRIMTNAGKTTSFGGEISLGWQARENLRFNGSYGYTNARFREFFNGIKDFKGKYLPYVPANTLFLQGIFEMPLKTGKYDSHLTFDLNMRGTGKIYWNEENNLYQNFYALLGASATLNIRKVEIKLWGKNLTSTKYYTFYFMSMGNEFLQRGRGAEGGLTVRYNF